MQGKYVYAIRKKDRMRCQLLVQVSDVLLLRGKKPDRQTDRQRESGAWVDDILRPKGRRAGAKRLSFGSIFVGRKISSRPRTLQQQQI